MCKKLQNSKLEISQKFLKSLIRLENIYSFVESDQKLNQLVNFLTKNKDKKFIVYFMTCACVDYFWKMLSNLSSLKNFPMLSLHGKVPAKKRQGKKK